MMMGYQWEDLIVDATQTSLDKGRVTTSHVMRWSAAVENFHRIHYDAPFAVGHDKLPGIVVNGSWKQHVLVQAVKDMLGLEGWLWRLSFRYKAMDMAGDSIKAVARVVDKKEVNGLGFVTLKLSIVNQRDEVTTAGYAIGVVPLPGGRKVPYPFVSDPAYQVIQMPAIE
jgi:acyl dehydratase